MVNSKTYLAVIFIHFVSDILSLVPTVLHLAFDLPFGKDVVEGN